MPKYWWVNVINVLLSNEIMLKNTGKKLYPLIQLYASIHTDTQTHIHRDIVQFSFA